MPEFRDLLKEPTVLVLGAGASKPYGFPVGNELKKLMINNLGVNNPQELLGQLNKRLAPTSPKDFSKKLALQAHGFDEKLINDFQEKLLYTSHPTIDIFLEKKPNFRELGSYLIASTIMPIEQHNRLFPQKDWYGELFNALDFENEKEPDTTLLSVVTLNYDRSLEHFLNKNIDYNCHNKYINSAHKKRTNITIVHAHGSLGEYPSVPYSLNSSETDTLRKAAESIKIVSDRLEDSPDFQRAQDVIATAYNIIFLGIGYNDRTLKALLAKTDLNSKQILGTSYKLDEPIKQHIREFFNNKITLGGGETCVEFLRNIALAH